jgi:hypothetical protein
MIRGSGLVLLLALPLTPAPAPTLDLAVNTTDDAVDAALDGVCADAAGTCPLRGAIQEANASLEDDTITLPAGVYLLKLVGANEDLGATGDLDVTGNVTVNGAGADATVIQGKKDRVVNVQPGVQLVLRDVTITKGKIGKKGETGDASSGGGIRNDGSLVLERVVVTRNKAADDGGGITNLGNLTLLDVTLSRNKAGDDAGAFDNDGGQIVLENVTVWKNKAKDEAGGFESEGVGIVTGTNVTISANKARDTGGANVEQGGLLVLTNVTVTGNKAKEGGGGLNNEGDAGSALELTNGILDKNKKVNCEGTIESLGGNVESGTSCGFAPPDDLGGVADMGLEPLADNGGPTETHAIGPDSPAVDFGQDTACPPTDQRDLPRFDAPAVQGSICDSGAFEFQGP